MCVTGLSIRHVPAIAGLGLVLNEEIDESELFFRSPVSGRCHFDARDEVLRRKMGNGRMR